MLTAHAARDTISAAAALIANNHPDLDAAHVRRVLTALYAQTERAAQQTLHAYAPHVQPIPGHLSTPDGPLLRLGAPRGPWVAIPTAYFTHSLFTPAPHPALHPALLDALRAHQDHPGTLTPDGFSALRTLSDALPIPTAVDLMTRYMQTG